MKKTYILLNICLMFFSHVYSTRHYFSSLPNEIVCEVLSFVKLTPSNILLYKTISKQFQKVLCDNNNELNLLIPFFAQQRKPIICAAQFQKPRLIKLLLQKKIGNVNEHENMKSPLLVAIEKKNIALVQCLISMGADVNQRVISENPLEAAVTREHYTITKLLLENGARTEDPKKLLISPCEFNNKFCIRFYTTPLKMAVFLNNFSLVNLLLGYKAKIDCEMLELAKKQNSKMHQLLLECFKKPEFRIKF